MDNILHTNIKWYNIQLSIHFYQCLIAENQKVIIYLKKWGEKGEMNSILITAKLINACEANGPKFYHG